MAAPRLLLQFIPALTTGLIIGLVEVILAISFAALIFAGPLSPFVGHGIGLALAGGALSGIAVAVLSSLPGMSSGNQDVPAAIVAVAAAAIVAAMPAGAGRQEAFITVVVAIGITTTLTGLLLFALGLFGLGSLVRFIPYPVLGGFLAGTGWLLMHGALGIMVDTVPPLSALGQLFQPDPLLRWLPGVLLAVLIVVLLKRTASVLVLPGAVLGGAALFYGVAALGNLGIDGASAGGWLLGPFPSGRLWPPLSLADLTHVHWPAIAAQAVNIAAIGLMSTIALLLNASGLELATRREVDFDRELRATGVGNIAAGLGCGLIGYQQLSLSAMNYWGRGGRAGPILASLLCAAVLFFGGSALSFLPKVVLGGLLFYLGLAFFIEWVIDSWSILPRTDYAIILLILLVTAVVGFMEAVGVGLLVAVVLFVVNYSRIDIVRDELTGALMQSRVTRRPAQRQFLRSHGSELHILRLQGFIFFGTADRLVDRVRRRLEDRAQRPPRYLLLDFRRVTGIDSTALWGFGRMQQLARSHGVSLVLTDVSDAIRRQFMGSDTLDEAVPIFADLDRGCEWCETMLLASPENADSSSYTDPLRQELLRILGHEEVVRNLLAYFERQEVPAGNYLIRQGDKPDVLFLIESGRVTAQLERAAGETARLQTMEGGHVLGELGFFLGMERTADVIADTPSVVYGLSQQARERMCAHDPAVASAFHQLIVHLLAERVVHLVTVVDALQQ
jgi:SulP family sulfate permease